MGHRKLKRSLSAWAREVIGSGIVLVLVLSVVLMMLERTHVNRNPGDTNDDLGK